MIPLRTIKRFDYLDFHIYKITSDVGFLWNFKMCAEDISIGAYYDGSMVVTEAANSAIIGTVFEGFYKFSHYPELNTLDSWMKCIVTKEMKEWYCIHSEKFKFVEYKNVLTQIEVQPNTAVYFLETETFNVPQETLYKLTGVGKVFLVY